MKEQEKVDASEIRVLDSSPVTIPAAPVNAQLRRQLIVELVREARDVSVTQICERLNASSHAIRRDLRILEEQGLVRRSYGRVMAVPGSLWELGIHERQMYRTDTYAKIADAGAKELGDAQTIFVDEGNLPGMAVPLLPTTKQLTIVTASLHTALSVAENSSHDVVMIGGSVRKRTMATIGFWARDMLSGMAIDLAFIGTNGVSVDKGLTTPDQRVAQIKREAIRCSQRNVLLCASSRFGLAQFVQFATIPDIDVFITDAGLTPRQQERMESAGAAFRITS
ncbi:MAG: DeoR/GlpR family DNA-binding transcription regulator [Scrofimicrobium sp.]